MTENTAMNQEYPIVTFRKPGTQCPIKSDKFLGYLNVSFEGLAFLDGLQLRAKRTTEGDAPGDMYVQFKSRKGKDKEGNDKWFPYSGPMDRETRQHLQDSCEAALVEKVSEGRVQDYQKDAEYIRIVWNNPQVQGSEYIMPSSYGTYGLAKGACRGRWFVNSVELWNSANGAFLKYPGEDVKDKEGNFLKTKDGKQVRNTWLRPAEASVREAIEDAAAAAYDAAMAEA